MPSALGIAAKGTPFSGTHFKERLTRLLLDQCSRVNAISPALKESLPQALIAGCDPSTASASALSGPGTGPAAAGAQVFIQDPAAGTNNPPIVHPVLVHYTPMSSTSV